MHEKTLASRRVFDGRILRVEVLDVELEDGHRSTREVVRHNGAAAALVRRSDGLFVLVRQFRKAVEQVMLEIVAGTLEPGEPPAECIKREICEETGYAPLSVAPLGYIYSAPGFCSERLDIFYAETDCAPQASAPDHDERVAAALLSAEELQGMIAAGQIHDAKTLAAWAMFNARIKADA